MVCVFFCAEFHRFRGNRNATIVHDFMGTLQLGLSSLIRRIQYSSGHVLGCWRMCSRLLKQKGIYGGHIDIENAQKHCIESEWIQNPISRSGALWIFLYIFWADILQSSSKINCIWLDVASYGKVVFMWICFKCKWINISDIL